MFAQIGLRLEEERKRLGLNQDQMAGLGGVAKRTYCNYEAGSREPGASLLASLAKIGADIQYIVTGQRQGHGIGEAAVHQAVLDAVDLLSLEKKVDAQQLAKAVTKLCAKAASAGASPAQGSHFEGGMQIFHQASTGEFAARDIVKTEKTRKG